MIKKKSRHELSLMRSAGKIVAEVHLAIENAIKVGVSTKELDEIAEKIIKHNGATASFKGYHGYPSSICASINEEVVHGIPSPERTLKEGDIIAVDIGATYKGFIADSAATYAVGEINEQCKRLLDATKQALYDAIEKMVEGNTLEDISAAVEDRGRMEKVGIVTQYGGHGVGTSLHEEPFIFNFRTGRGTNIKLKRGMTLAVEPMFNLGTGDVHTLKDGWTVVTNDGLPSAHFEHTIAITDDAPLILTEL